MYIFSWAFLWGCTVSVVFGIWGKYLGGFEVLQHFYSTTISSWVPGQVLPLYHGTGEAIRMQGASSGPIEFAHVLMVGMAIILFRFLPIQLYQGKMKWFVAALAVLTFFGIVESLSRAVILILVIWMLYFRFFPKGVCTMPSFRKTRVWILLFFFILAGGGIFLMNKKSVQRLSDSDHFIRPLQAIQIGIQKPIMGHLGEFGPAARLRNLQTYNNDQAPIAENVFADWFAQLGLIGLALGIGFFVSLFRDTRREHWPFLVATVLASQVATIYDMTPISISFFLMFAFFVKIRTIFLYI
ncbi:hypothetical protein K9L27_01310 [Candidatus Gracilibacteria bacterium]|nr:hypothetical protein [Candidatus Gracilibacteria bacterium]